MGSYAIIGAHLPIAAGAAWSAQYRGTEQVAVCFFGDGTTNIGAFHEALNFAAVWKLPVVFVCENNLYMEYTPIGAGDRGRASRPPTAPAPTGSTSIIVDGNDADAVYRTARDAIARARKGGGPALIEAKTYRHSGHSRADPAQVPAGRRARGMARSATRSPLYRERLLELGIAEATLKRHRGRGRWRKVDEATETAKASPPPSLDDHREGRVGRRRRRMAELTYRDAVAAGIAQEMGRDERVVFLGEDVAARRRRVQGDRRPAREVRARSACATRPISEQAILGAAMGAAMTGLRPIAEIMFSDFLAVCWDIVANEIAKTRYMTDGQITLPLVIRTANGAGSRFGAQHSQSVENWAMAMPGLKVVAPAIPADVKGLLAAAVRDPDPVLFFEQKSLYSMKGEVPDGEHVDELGKAKVLRQGKDCTIVALAADGAARARGAPRCSKHEHGISCDGGRRALAGAARHADHPAEVAKTGRLVTVEENPRLCGWGAEIASIVAEECFWDLDGADRAHHHAARAAALGRRARGRDHPVGRAHRRDRAPQHGLRWRRWT